MNKLLSTILIILVATVSCMVRFDVRAEPAQPADKSNSKNTDWPVYGGQLAGDHYSPLAQINRSNVSKLKVTWTFDTGERAVCKPARS